MDLGGEMRLDGRLAAQRIAVPTLAAPKTTRDLLRLIRPERGQPDEVNDWRSSNWRRVLDEYINVVRGPGRAAARHGLLHVFGQLGILVLRADGSRLDLGIAGYKLIVTAGKTFVRDDFNAGGAEITNLKFHAVGTGVAAAAAGDTGLGTEWTAAEYPGDVRATGSQTTNGATVYRTIGTNTKENAGTSAVTEWGLFSSGTIAAATLFDRQVFSAINLNQNDSIQTTYDLTIG